MDGQEGLGLEGRHQEGEVQLALEDGGVLHWDVEPGLGALQQANIIEV